MTTETVTVLTDEQIKRIALTTPDRDILEVVPFVRAIEQAVLQSPEVQAWKRDAERYRHLRDEAGLSPHDIFNAWWLSEHGNPQTIDEAADISMEKQP